MEFKHKVRTCLFFATEAEEAANFYVSLLPGSGIDNLVRPDPLGPALVIEFTLGGMPMMAMNGNSNVESSHTQSISVLTEDQEETDRLWTLLTAGGGAEGRCGWLQDRYGIHWQIVPKALPELMSTGDAAQGARVQAALMTMSRIDIAGLEAAAA